MPSVLLLTIGTFLTLECMRLKLRINSRKKLIQTASERTN